MTGLAFGLLLAVGRPPRPEIEQQVTWFYSKSLTAGVSFFRDVLELEQVLDQGPCKIFRTA